MVLATSHNTFWPLPAQVSALRQARNAIEMPLPDPGQPRVAYPTSKPLLIHMYCAINLKDLSGCYEVITVIYRAPTNSVCGLPNSCC